MRTTYEKVIEVIAEREAADVMNDEYIDYMMSMLDMYLMFKRISEEQYQEIMIKLELIKDKNNQEVI